ncbi:hypothetical protein [Flavobacterium sp. LAR06]|uniref:hypothetical protein n=1 Tax=Flavobacterium sp. LAR06 TaxID=3064897 RepID=UPI0035C157F6
MANVLFQKGTPRRDRWLYFTELELSPGAVRVGHFMVVFNTRGNKGAQAGSDSPGQQLGWRGDKTYVATVLAICDLWQDPQEYYDFADKSSRYIFVLVLKYWAYKDKNMSY